MIEDHLAETAHFGSVVHFAHLPADHLLHQFAMRVVDPSEAVAAIEADLLPLVENGHRALQGGLIATMVDVVGGRAVQAGLIEPST